MHHNRHYTHPYEISDHHRLHRVGSKQHGTNIQQNVSEKNESATLCQAILYQE